MVQTRVKQMWVRIPMFLKSVFSTFHQQIIQLIECRWGYDKVNHLLKIEPHQDMLRNSYHESQAVSIRIRNSPFV